MSSDKGFLSLFLKEKGRFSLIILFVGVLLILIGSISGGGSDKEALPTLEERVGDICSMTEGVGECRVMITYESDGETVYGVAVLCEGAGSDSVEAEITDLLCSLFGIGANRISILKIN